jgi:hypothetical protein
MNKRKLKCEYKRGNYSSRFVIFWAEVVSEVITFRRNISPPHLQGEEVHDVHVVQWNDNDSKIEEL